MTRGPDKLDVKTALATLNRAFDYAAPLERRTEGITWIFFGLVSSLFMFSFAWSWQQAGWEPPALYRYLVAWLAGYAFLATVPALLTWRVAGVVQEGYAVGARRVASSMALLALALVAVYYAIWMTLGESSDGPAVAKVILALHIVLFGGAAWAVLGVAQWTRMGRQGRRDTLALGAIMAVACAALMVPLRVEPGGLNVLHPAFTIVVNHAALVFVLAFGLVPLLAGLWRLAKA